MTLLSRGLFFPLALLLLTTLACNANPFRSEPAPAPEVSAAQVASQDAATGAELAITADAALPLTFVELLDAPLTSFSPVLDDSPAARSVQNKILPRLLALDAQSGEVQPGGLAQGWQWSPDGRTLTLALRTELQWSDGAPVTALDAGFTLAASSAPAVQSPLQRSLGMIETADAADDSTLVITLRAPDCSVLQALTLPLLPSHLFAPDLSDVVSNPWNSAPSVGAGPFLFEEVVGPEVRLLRNAGYAGDLPEIERYVLRSEENPQARSALLADGTAQLAAGLPADALALPASLARTSVLLKDGYSLLAFNLADPALAAQPGRDANGALVAQTPHPILGDPRVRRAIAAGVNFGAIVSEVYGPDAAPLASWVLPTIPWAAATELAPYAHDLARAASLLDEAGWRDAAGDGVREQGDSLLQLTLITNADNPRRVQMGERVRDGLQALGFAVRFEALDFATASAAVLEQRFDLAILGFERLGADPAALDFFESTADIPGTGLNFFSYHNAEVDGWLAQARAMPGCGTPERGELYRQAQRRIYEEIPVIMLSGQVNRVAVDSAWQGITAGPWALDSGLEFWRAQP